MQRVELPHPDRVVAGSGRLQRGVLLRLEAVSMDGEFGRSLVCIGNHVLSLAVVSTALQKLHKCVTQNTTELLQEIERRQVNGLVLDALYTSGNNLLQ